MDRRGEAHRWLEVAEQRQGYTTFDGPSEARTQDAELWLDRHSIDANVRYELSGGRSEPLQSADGTEQAPRERRYYDGVASDCGHDEVRSSKCPQRNAPAS